MQADDQVAEWLIRWEEAVLTDRPPPAPDELPPELRPRARAGLGLLRGFARMSHGLTTPAPPGDAPQAPPDTPRYRFEGFLARGGMAEVWRGCDTLLAREVALKVLRGGCSRTAGSWPGSRRRPGHAGRPGCGRSRVGTARRGRPDQRQGEAARPVLHVDPRRRGDVERLLPGWRG